MQRVRGDQDSRRWGDILYEAPEHIEHSCPTHGQRGVKLVGTWLLVPEKPTLPGARLIHGDADFDGTAMIRQVRRIRLAERLVRGGPTRRHYLTCFM